VAEVPLAGRSAIVTGGTRGLGLEIARAFAAAGARVLVTGREPAELDVESIRADVSDAEACAAVVERAGTVDVLVNNAAITGPVGPVETLDWDAWTATIATNLLGPVLMCRAVLPGMRERGAGKIINLSGGGATGPRPNFSAYATAKAGLVRFTETLARELDGSGVDVNAIAPGALNTRMRDDVLAAGPERAGAEYHEARERGETSFEPATRLAVFLASAASDGISGRLLAALWDDWAALKPPLDPDVYTLRRILP
jgi:NAD(P)-dependent dehydrogenase (short-subunit alcohol dehydrogenase family)